MNLTSELALTPEKGAGFFFFFYEFIGAKLTTPAGEEEGLGGSRSRRSEPWIGRGGPLSPAGAAALSRVHSAEREAAVILSGRAHNRWETVCRATEDVGTGHRNSSPHAR